jgi:tRNA G37 N-methylase TrmD
MAMNLINVIGTFFTNYYHVDEIPEDGGRGAVLHIETITNVLEMFVRKRKGKYRVEYQDVDSKF